jgi:hypothetical protein
MHGLSLGTAGEQGASSELQQAHHRWASCTVPLVVRLLKDAGVNDARLRGNRFEGVDCQIVLERHHALNWLIGYQDQAGDEVSTDT